MTRRRTVLLERDMQGGGLPCPADEALCGSASVDLETGPKNGGTRGVSFFDAGQNGA